MMQATVASTISVNAPLVPVQRPVHGSSGPVNGFGRALATAALRTAAKVLPAPWRVALRADAPNKAAPTHGLSERPTGSCSSRSTTVHAYWQGRARRVSRGSTRARRRARRAWNCVQSPSSSRPESNINRGDLYFAIQTRNVHPSRRQGLLSGPLHIVKCTPRLFQR